VDITKLEAAKYQLGTAIRLYFEDRDPVSVHTLVSAAWEVIEKLCEDQGHVGLRALMKQVIAPAHHREVGDALNKARNFFKHGSNPSATLSFNEDQNLGVIAACIYGLTQLGVEIQEAKPFLLWLWLVEPYLLDGPPPDTQTVETTFGEDLQNKPRADQKRVGRELLARGIP
jgi:hypothetical protein